jgi:hypothetical protein
MWNLVDPQYVKVTAAYSNAVLVAILPHISDFAHRLAQKLPEPLTLQSVKVFGCDNNLGETGGAVQLTNNSIFVFSHGNVKSFHSAFSYYNLADFNLIHTFYGTNRLSREQAISLCREAIVKLGFREEQVYADLDPEVRSPHGAGNHVIPRYQVTWSDPRNGRACEFEVNSQEGRIESVNFFTRCIWGAPPKISVPAVSENGKTFRSRFQPVNSAYSAALLTAIMPIISDFCHCFELPVTLPVTTNQIACSSCATYEGDVYVHLTLTSNDRMLFRHGIIECWDASDAFFDFAKPCVKTSDFRGGWRMSDAEAIAVARLKLKELGYSLESVGADSDPEVIKPLGAINVPRLKIEWIKGRDGIMLSHVIMEVDAQNRLVKSFSLFCPALGRRTADVGVSPVTGEVWEVAPPFPPSVRTSGPVQR